MQAHMYVFQLCLSDCFTNIFKLREHHEPQKHHAKWEKPDTKDHMLYEILKNKTIVTENRPVVICGQGQRQEST